MWQFLRPPRKSKQYFAYLWEDASDEIGNTNCNVSLRSVGIN